VGVQALSWKGLPPTREVPGRRVDTPTPNPLPARGRGLRATAVWRLISILAFAAASPATAAPARLAQPQVRAFVERQSQAWNAGDLAAYFATFTPDARFTDQALGNDNKVVPYGVSSVAQARTQARKTLAKSKVRETTAVTAVSLAPDGRSARVTANTRSEITAAGAAPRQVCAMRVATVAQTPQGLRTTAQTDTIVRCRAGAVR
jgi:hypothetical protein